MDRFHRSLEDLDSDRVQGVMAAVLEGLTWIDPEGELNGATPTDVLMCTTFGETMHHAVDVTVGRFTLRYPGPGQPRSPGLVCVDGIGLVGTIEDLAAELLALADPDAAAIAERLAMDAARAGQPDGSFQWTGTGIAQAYAVVGEVEHWPGQIQLQAARTYEPEVRIGDEIWLGDRELIPVCWVLDWLRD